MKLKNIKLKNLIIVLVVALIYPIYKTVTMDNKLVAFADSTFILSLVLIIIGIFNYLYIKGDFDTFAYIARRSFLKKYDYTLNDYMNELSQIRKDSFDYPLFVGIIFLIISIIANIIYFI